MVLYIIGLGLGDEKDITVRGLEAVRSCSRIFLEAYTSVLGGVSKARLEEYYEKSIQVADRNFVEGEAQEIYEPAKTENVALLVVGDPVCATTHSDIILRAKEYGVTVQVIHNASIMGAVGSCGLQLYNFGQTVSIPFYEDNWRPTSFCAKIAYNRQGGMHTLCLLDIKVKEPDFEAMKRGRTVFLPPRFMSVATAAQQLIQAVQISPEEAKAAYDPSQTPCVGLARMGQQDRQLIVVGTLQELAKVDCGPPLHSLVICGDLHELEWDMLREFILHDSVLSTQRPGQGQDAKEQQQQKQPIAREEVEESESAEQSKEGDGDKHDAEK